MSEREQYIPGVCNIGKQEIKRRRNGAILSGIISFALMAALIYFKAAPLWRLTIFLPVAWFGISVQQVTNKFCVNLGMKGLFNFGDLGHYSTVEQAEMHKADRNKAVKMIVLGVVYGVFVASIFYMIPANFKFPV